MPTITEETENDLYLADEPDFTQLLDLGQPEQGSLGLAASADIAPTDLPSTYNGFGTLGEWELPDLAADPSTGLDEPDYSRFENWIPKFVWPESPCDYCRSKRLNCYKITGEAKCTACSTLFRECSLEDHEIGANLPAHTVDTLHVVDEDVVKERGTVTGIKQLKSTSRGNSSSSLRSDDEPGSSKRNGIRFPRHAVKTLRDWLDAHTDNPYPTEEEKAELEEKTELKPSQIANWLANARRRRKAIERSRPKVCASPSLGPTTPAMDIPSINASKPWDELNPFERWRHSPPENEPADILDIADAVAQTEPLDDVSTSPSTLGRKKRSSNGSGFSNVRAPSSTSLDTSSLSASNSAHFSAHSSRSHGSFGSFSSSLAGKRDRRRRKRAAPATARKPSDDKKRIFQCTFCTDVFRSKYDWTRHEKSLHLSLEKWLCAPLGPIITDSACQKRCVYCNELSPTPEHCESHNHRQCEEKGLDARTFYRKDHLRQHLRLMHGCEMTSSMESWKSVAVNINSRCGFCAQRFSVWQDRVDHLTAHFKAGAKMTSWRGCRGLDPAVAAQVTNAMPPYLIGTESKSPVPYSATNRSTWRMSSFGAHEYTSGVLQTDHETVAESHNSAGRATCWEILTVRLGKYANEMTRKGETITDEMLQAAARRFLYDDDDAWNQTAADNPEWLDLFKKAHGLDIIPSRIGGQGHQIPQDLETYGDLGLRIPFSVQLQAYNQEQAASSSNCTCPQIAEVHTLSQHPKLSQELRKIYKQLVDEGVLHGLDNRCAHRECDNNIVDLSAIDGRGSGSKKLSWCIYSLPPDTAKRLSYMAAVQGFKTPGAGDQDAGEDKVRQRSRNFHRSLEALVSMDTRLTAMGKLSHPPSTRAHTSQMPPGQMAGERVGSYTPRHKLEPSQDRAQLFATTTGPWADSGTMADAMSTQQRIFNQEGTTTGAMTEFLEGDLTFNLPFSNDNSTSEIPFGPMDNFSWPASKTVEEQQQVMDEFDRIIAETTAAQAQPSGSAFMNDNAPTATTFGNDALAGNDLNFDDMEMDFDGVFDMPMDETFVPTAGAGL